MSFGDLFIGYTEETQLSKRAISQRKQCLKRIDSRKDTSLHIADTWAIQSLALKPKRACASNANGIHGIGMPQQQYISIPATLHDTEQIVAPLVAFNNVDLHAQTAHACRQAQSHLVQSRLIIAICIN